MHYQPGRYGAILSMSLSLCGICTCLHGYMCASTHAHVCICMWVASLIFFPTLVSEMESLTEYGNRWLGWDGWPRSSTDQVTTASWCWHYRHIPLHTAFMSAGGWDSCPHTCVTSPLPVEPSCVCSYACDSPWVVLCFSSTPQVLDSKLLNSRTWCCG